jgi:TRAP-type C4-dicarboxylate transport system substrate-binding protein
VQRLEDFKGLKARFISASEKPFWEALGVNTVSMSTEQLYVGLQSGQINALFTVPTGIKAFSLWDFTKYATLPYLSYPDSLIVANAKWWNNLPQDIRETVTKEVVPKVEHDSLQFVMDDAKAVLDEFVKQKAGTVFALRDDEIKTLKEVCSTMVWPRVVEKFDPAFWDAVTKQQGIGK